MPRYAQNYTVGGLSPSSLTWLARSILHARVVEEVEARSAVEACSAVTSVVLVSCQLSARPRSRCSASCALLRFLIACDFTIMQEAKKGYFLYLRIWYKLLSIPISKKEMEMETETFEVVSSRYFRWEGRCSMYEYYK